MLHQRPNQNRKVSFLEGMISRCKNVANLERNSKMIKQLNYFWVEEAAEGEAAEGETAEGEAAEGGEGAEGLPEGYPVDEEGMKVEVRTITFI